MKSDVYFIIVTFNSQSYIDKCIGSILLFEPNCSIIVIDNGSNDNTLNLLNKYHELTVVRNKKNLGFGSANNIGIKLAIEKGANYLYLLNHDAYLIEPVVEKLKNISIENHFGILTPLQVSPNEKTLECNFEKILYDQGLFNGVIENLILLKGLQDCYNVKYFQAASWFIRKEVIMRVGLFSTLFFHYGEDNDYLNRVNFHGFRTGIVFSLRVVHIANPKKYSYDKNFDWYHRNREISKFLVQNLNINESLNYFGILNKLLGILKSIYIDLVIFNWFRVINKLIFLITVIIKIPILKKERDKNFKIPSSVTPK